MNFKTILMPKVILAKFLSQKNYSYLTFLTFKCGLESLEIVQSEAIEKQLIASPLRSLLQKKHAFYDKDFILFISFIFLVYLLLYEA